MQATSENQTLYLEDVSNHTTAILWIDIILLLLSL